MASFSSQWSRAVLAFVVFQQAYTHVTTNVQEALAQNELHILSKMFQKLNKHFDLDDASFDVNLPVNSNTTETMETNSREQITTKMESNTILPDSENINIQRRSEGNVPWHCDSRTNWKDLGNLHYPRFVKEDLCLGDSCFHGFYSCSPQYYTIRVLTARENEDSLDIALPRSLRQDWKFMDMDISAGCYCGN